MSHMLNLPIFRIWGASRLYEFLEQEEEWQRLVKSCSVEV